MNFDGLNLSEGNGDTPQSKQEPDALTQWTDSFFEVLPFIATDGRIPTVVRRLVDATDWELVATRTASGSNYSDVLRADTEPMVAANAGHLFLLHHRHTAAWATYYVPYCLSKQDATLWNHADDEARKKWLTASTYLHTHAAETVTELFDLHAANLDSDPGMRMQISDSHFMACSVILKSEHPDTDALQMLAAFNGWVGPGRRTDGDHPLRVRIADIEFAALCGARRRDVYTIVTAYLAETGQSIEFLPSRWVIDLPSGTNYEGLPALSDTSPEGFEKSVRAWCANQKS